MDLLPAIDAICSSPLQPHADALIDLLRPSIRIRTTRDLTVKVGDIGVSDDVRVSVGGLLRADAVPGLWFVCRDQPMS